LIGKRVGVDILSLTLFFLKTIHFEIK